MSRTGRKRQIDNVEQRRLMEAMREEVAREFGLQGAGSTEFANLTSKICGTYGQRLWKRAQELLDQTEDSLPKEKERTRAVRHVKTDRKHPN